MEFADVLTALRNSHDRLAAAVAPLTAEQVGGQSYDDDWTIAQVASHLGSGAEIFDMIITAGLNGAAAPGPEEIKPIWEAWNAKPAPVQVTDAVRADAAFADRVAALTPEEAERWQLDLFGGWRSLPSVLAMRLSEHAVHTWDIVVALDPFALVAADAVDIILGILPGFAERAGKGASEDATVHITTTGPERQFLLELSGDRTRLTPAGGATEAAATLRLPAEALVRLVYGRLDPGHTPASVVADGIDLGTLRSRFPGI